MANHIRAFLQLTPQDIKEKHGYSEFSAEKVQEIVNDCSADFEWDGCTQSDKFSWVANCIQHQTAINPAINSVQWVKESVLGFNY